MIRTGRNTRIFLGVIIAAGLLGFAAVKVLYLGVRQTPMGKVRDHRVVFCWTWSSLGSLVSNDGREGFYRIYDEDGQKVFEQFTDTYAFDIVLPGETEVEFQLDATDSVFWPPRE